MPAQDTRPGPLLLVDSSSPVTTVGILHDGEWLACCESGEEALNAIFAATRSCLSTTKLSLKDMAGFVFGKGPGSVLGIRLSAMALKTWLRLPECRGKPVLNYNSLRMQAALLRENRPDGFHLVSEFKRGLWHLLSVPSKEAAVPVPMHVGKEELTALKGTILHLRQRKMWAELPVEAEPAPYDLKPLPRHWPALEDLMTRGDSPELEATKASTYAKWDRRPHRKPANQA